jgi:hypothetical protein
VSQRRCAIQERTLESFVRAGVGPREEPRLTIVAGIHGGFDLLDPLRLGDDLRVLDVTASLREGLVLEHDRVAETGVAVREDRDVHRVSPSKASCWQSR